MIELLGLRLQLTRSAVALCIVSLVGLTDTAAAQDPSDPEARLAALGLALPTPYQPIAIFVRAVRTGNLVFLGGLSECEERYTTGKVGANRTITEGYDAARLTALCLLASLKAEIGDLNKVVRIVRVYGMVNSTESFTGHSQVINGCSDLLVAVFGERGHHARAAVGMTSLPLDFAVEIEMVVEVTEE